MAEVLRTPEDRFAGLADYPFAPAWITVDDPDLGPLGMHYVDEGPKDAAPVVLLHGEPSWSYLYRKFIPKIAGAGLRALAPDLIGFGKSDKPSAQEDYSYSRHVRWLHAWFDALDLSNVTLFVQDWGGLLGLRIAAERPDRIAKIMAGNTFLPTGAENVPDAFFAWRDFANSSPDFVIGAVLDMGTQRALADAEKAAYDAPFPDEAHKAGARAFPALVPTSPEMDGAADNAKAWEVLSKWDKPFLTCHSDKDPITAGGDKAFQKRIPGCAGQPHFVTEGAGHFLQEDAPELLTERLIAFAKS
jgi:haloalkane dehalogenase